MADLRISSPHGIWAIHRWSSEAADERILCFHGFARTGEDFKDWGSFWEGKLEVLAPDLPHHGETEWSDQPYDRQTLLQLFENLCSGKPYWLAGFSFGGRVLLSLLHLLPKPPKGIILMAPEGVETERLGFWKQVPNSWRKGLVHWAAADGRGLRIAKRLNKVGMIDSFSVKFVRKQLEDERSVQRLLAAWNALHAFPIDVKDIRQFFETTKTPLLLMGSEGDKIVDIQPIARQLQSIYPDLDLEVLREPGHNQLIRASLEKADQWIDLRR